MARGSDSTPIAPIALVSPEQLEQLVRAAVRAEVAELAATLRPTTPAVPEYLTMAEVALRLRCSRRHVQTLVSLGRLRSTRLLGRSAKGPARVLISAAEVERLLGGGT